MANPPLKIVLQNDLYEKVAVVVGTRPSIVKMSPLIRELGKRGVDHFVIHTGQHYTYEMDRKFFEDLELAPPKYHLDSVSQCYFHGEQTAEMIRGVEQALLDGRSRVVLVCGDANTNLAAGLAARKLQMIVGHVESGLRSCDWSMPEEHNRIILDHICELLFAPTEEACRNLIRDNVRGEIHLTGNTIVDAVYQNLEIARGKSDVLHRLSLHPKEYIVCTSHREENVDIRERLEGILTGLELVAEQFNISVIFPIHPRTLRRLEEFGLANRLKQTKNGISIIEPLGYLDFLLLLAESRLVLTDSGGIQEESCILRIPCVTLRDNTERPETLEVGANRLAGVKPDQILSATKLMYWASPDWKNPFGDGTAARQIVDIAQRALVEGVSLFDNSSVTRRGTQETIEVLF